ALTYALDASLIDLSLAIFPWGVWQHTAAAVKLHTLLSLRGPVPAWAAVSEAGVPDVRMLDQVPLQSGAFYVMDRGYLDFTRLARLHAGGVFFVVRSKCHVRLRVRVSRAVDKRTGLRCDQTVRLTSSWSRRAFPAPLRRVRVRDAASGRSLVLLSNHFGLPALTVAELYRRRWQVELFFKWIKQHLRLRAFLGRSENAVRLQVWSAICAYLLVAIAKKELGLPQTLHQILQVISVSVFEPVPLTELFNTPATTTPTEQLLLIP
ncbi:MAG: IS4 family transposase, partial [Verrucomicrobiae bacterium]|nr:IS4 family transposase [Verrucomicrobiae bacterium]